MENNKINKTEALQILAADKKLQEDLFDAFSIKLKDARIVESETGYKYPVLTIEFDEFEYENEKVTINKIRRYMMPFREHHLQICATEEGEFDCGSSIPINFKFEKKEVIATIAAELIYEYARSNMKFAPYKLTRYYNTQFTTKETKPQQYEFAKFIELIMEMGI